MTETKALAIAHYERMIEWAEKQPFLFAIDAHLMEKSIGENWQGDYCSYCYCEIDSTNLICSGCNLCAENNSNICCDGLWSKLNAANSWGEWIFAAEAVLQFIRDNG